MDASTSEPLDPELRGLLFGTPTPDPGLLFDLAPVLPELLVPMAIDIARNLPRRALRVRVLAALAARRPVGERTSLLREVIAMMPVERDNDLPFAFGWMAPYLPQSLHKEALQKAFSFIFGPMQEAGIVALAPFLDESLQEAALEHVLNHMRPSDRNAALAGLAPHLTDSLKRRIEEAAQTIKDDEEKRRVLVALETHPPVPPSDIVGELAKARAIAEPYWKVQALLELVPYLKEPVKGEVLREAFSTTDRDKDHEYFWYPGIAALAARPDAQAAVEARSAIRLRELPGSRRYAVSLNVLDALTGTSIPSGEPGGTEEEGLVGYSIEGSWHPKNGGGKSESPLTASPTVGPAKRVVNTWFSPRAHPDEHIKATMPLRSGATVYFCLNIDRPEGKSIEVTPMDIPPVSARSRLTVAVFGFRNELKPQRGADVGELEVQEDGSVVVARQPLQAVTPRSHHLERDLYFPIRVPNRPGTFRLRCNIYLGQLLLQTRIVFARAMSRPRRVPRGKKALRSVVDYTLARTLSPAYLNELPEHRLSLLLNDNGDGTHSFHFFGADDQTPFKQDDVRFQESELQGMISQARGTLRQASWESDQEWDDKKHQYRYKDQQLDLARLKVDLINLAGWGYEFYTAICGRLAGGDEREAKKAARELQELMRRPGSVQIALKQSARYILPAALIYDYPLDVGASQIALCPSFEAALRGGQPLEDLACFDGACPSHGNLRAVCPSGFWGFRHDLGLPLSVKNAPDVPTQIKCGPKFSMAVGVASDLQLFNGHVKNLIKLREGIEWTDQRDKFFDWLKAYPDIVYFYCHGGLVRNAPYLQLGPKDNPGLVQRSNLYAYEIVWEQPRPLVFINGCHTTAVEPLQALEFITPLVTYSQAAGVIGTEITIFEELATVFAEECFQRFFAGEPIGRAVRRARLRLLAEGNPLGLVYIPFVIAGLRLVEQ